MNIALTGATGTLGRALLKTLGNNVIPIDRTVLDLSKPKDVEHVLKAIDFDVLIHTAAYTDVDGCEENKDLALKVNWLSTREIARFTGKTGRILLYISTDYVFDGSKEQYHEWDAPNPLSIYGLTKFYGEREVLYFNPRSYVVRTSWIFGPGGKTFISKLPDLLKENEELKVVADQWSKPTYASDLAEAIKILIEKKLPYGIYHISGGKPATPYRIAEEVKKLLKARTRLTPASWEDLHTKAKRPKRSILSSELFEFYTGYKLPGYPDSLRRYLNDRGD